MAISERALAILRRFPRHFSADDPTKLFAAVVGALAQGVDVETSQIGRVRRAHRLDHADEHIDLLRLAALHGLREGDFVLLEKRLGALPTRASYATELELLRDRIREVIALHRQGNGTVAALIGGAANALDLDVLAIRHLAHPSWHEARCVDRFGPFAVELVADGGDTIRLGGTADLPQWFRVTPGDHTGRASLATWTAGETRVIPDGVAVLPGTTLTIRVGEGPTRTVTFQEGSAFPDLAAVTATQLADAINAALEAEPAQPAHAVPGMQQRSRRAGTADAQPADDYVYLEENPFREVELAPVERKHAELFLVRRVGFDPVVATVRVHGVEQRTMWPMLVQRDLGVGVVFAGAVPDGKELRFERADGTVTLDGADVSTSAFSFSGAVFADANDYTAASEPAHANDFAWADATVDPTTLPARAARFPTTRPLADAFDDAFVWPRAAGAIETPSIAVGLTRFAFFVRVAHFGTQLDDGTAVAVEPTTISGIFDGSIYAWDPTPDQPAGKIGFEWDEREAFTVRVWLPGRFQDLDVEGDSPVREKVRALLDRHRAAGVHVYVSYADDTWTLGEGVLPGDGGPEGLVIHGTVLSPDGEPQPT